MSSIVLMIWYNDDPIQGNVLKIGNIVEPRVAYGDYRKGQHVRVKCPGFGIQSGIIGKIGDESQRKDFQSILNGPQFKELVEKVCKENRVDPEYSVEDDTVVTTGRIPRVKKRSLPNIHPDGSESEVCSDDGSGTNISVQLHGLGEKCSDDHDDEHVQRPQKKAKKQTTKDTEAMQAKKDVAKMKRDTNKARERTNQMASSVLVDGMETGDSTLASEKLIAIANNTESILTLVHQLCEKQATLEQQLAEMASCKQCVKALYKKLKPDAALRPPSSQRTLSFTAVSQSSPLTPSTSCLSETSTPSATSSLKVTTPSTSSLKVTTPSTSSLKVTTPSTSSLKVTKSLSAPNQCGTPKGLPANGTESMDDDIQLDVDVQETQTTENTDELAFLGDSLYGVQVDKKRLQNCEMASSKIDKLALNILELLITKDECANLSIYGQAKGKVALAPAKRKALRSHIFQLYGKDMHENQKETLWMNDIVKKLNDKIRGIKNNKYKLGN